MTFFETPELPEPPPRPARPVWAGPPQGVLPGHSDQRAVLVRTDEAIMYADAFRVYPNGLEFAITVLIRDPQLGHGPAPFEMHGPRPGISNDDLVRFGVLFADGSKWTNLDPHPPFGRGVEEGFAGRVVMSQGGGGGDAHWRMRYWMWPLPEPPQMTFVVSWPAQGIDEATVDVDTTLLRQAAEDTEVVWTT